MDIILLKDVDKVGDKHEVVSVKSGYGRNFLIPQKLAVIANATNLKKLETLKAEEEAKEAARLSEYREMAEKIDGKSVNIAVKSGTSGKIFGSVSNVQVAQAIKEQLGVEVERKKVILGEEIKELGDYHATVYLHKEVAAKVNLTLVVE